MIVNRNISSSSIDVLDSPRKKCGCWLNLAPFMSPIIAVTEMMTLSHSTPFYSQHGLSSGDRIRRTWLENHLEMDLSIPAKKKLHFFRGCPASQDSFQVFPSVSKCFQVFPGWYRWCFFPDFPVFFGQSLQQWIQKPGLIRKDLYNFSWIILQIDDNC